MSPDDGSDSASPAPSATRVPGADRSVGYEPPDDDEPTEDTQESEPAPPATRVPGADRSVEYEPPDDEPTDDAEPAPPATRVPGADRSVGYEPPEQTTDDAEPAPPATRVPGADRSTGFERAPTDLPSIDGVSDDRLQDLQQRVASGSELVDPTDVQIQRDGNTIRAFVPLDAQKQAFRERVARRQDVPESIVQISAENDRLTATIDETQFADTGQPTGQDAQAVLDIEAENVTEITGESVGQTTDPTLTPGDLQQPSAIDVATDAGTTFLRNPVSAPATFVAEPAADSLEAEASEAAGFDIGETATATGSTLLNRPIDSTVTGVVAMRTGATAIAADASAGDVAAAVPAGATGTATGTATGVGLTAASLVGVPAVAATTGLAGVRERGVTLPPVETARIDDEVTIEDGTRPGESQSEIETPSNITVVGGSEITVEEGTRPGDTVDEITIDEDTRPGDTVDEVTIDEDTRPGETIDEVDVPIDETPTGERETDAVIDQPTGGFDDLPRDDELGEQVTEETDTPPDSIIDDEANDEDILEQFDDEDISNLPLEEQQYLQEEIQRQQIRREDSLGSADSRTFLFGDVLGSTFDASTTRPELSTEFSLDTSPSIFGTPGATGVIDSIVDTDVIEDTPTETQPQNEMVNQTETQTEVAVAEPTAMAFEYSYAYEYASETATPSRPILPDILDSESPILDPMDSESGVSETETGLFKNPLSGVFEE